MEEVYLEIKSEDTFLTPQVVDENEIKKEFSFSESLHDECSQQSLVKPEDTNMQWFDIQPKLEVSDSEEQIETDNYIIYIKRESLESDEIHIKNNDDHNPTEQPIFTCTICDFKCIRKGNLQQHIKTHTGEKALKCNICNYKTTYTNRLKCHMKIHTGEKNFKCNICDYKCTEKSRLNNHMKTHTREQPFKCNLCDYKYKWKNSLIYHIKSHTGEKPFQCFKCDYKCAQKCTLQRHMKKHTGKKTSSMQCS